MQTYFRALSSSTLLRWKIKVSHMWWGNICSTSVLQWGKIICRVLAKCDRFEREVSTEQLDNFLKWIEKPWQLLRAASLAYKQYLNHYSDGKTCGICWKKYSFLQKWVWFQFFLPSLKTYLPPGVWKITDFRQFRTFADNKIDNRTRQETKIFFL